MALLRNRFVFVCIIPILAACAGSHVEHIPQPTQTLRPPHTATSTLATNTTPPVLHSLPPLEPTPTPLVHTVQAGETLLGIAMRYGVGLDDLLVANPGIDPSLLSIGLEVIIPGPEGGPVGALLPTPTPVPITLSDVRCYLTPSGSMWCLTTARNTASTTIEGLVVLVTLLDLTGHPLAHEPAYSPLDIVPQGGLMPLAAFFLDPPSEQVLAVATLLSAVQANEVGDRYSDLIIKQDLSERGLNGRCWRVQGEVMLPETSQESAARVSVLLLAQDVDGEIVGFIKWEAETELEPGDVEPFDLTVFSLGPIIDHVITMAEARMRGKECLISTGGCFFSRRVHWISSSH